MNGDGSRTVSSEPAGKPVPEILLIRTCGDTTLATAVRKIRASFPEARIVLLSSFFQPPPPVIVEEHHVHAGGKRALIQWLRSRRWAIVAVPDGDDVLWRWKVTLPLIVLARRRIVVWPDGASDGLDVSLWARAVYRRVRIRMLRASSFRAPRGIRLRQWARRRASRGVDALILVVAVVGMLVRVPLRIGPALLHKPGSKGASALN